MTSKSTQQSEPLTQANCLMVTFLSSTTAAASTYLQHWFIKHTEDNLVISLLCASKCY